MIWGTDACSHVTLACQACGFVVFHLPSLPPRHLLYLASLQIVHTSLLSTHLKFNKPCRLDMARLWFVRAFSRQPLAGVSDVNFVFIHTYLIDTNLHWLGLAKKAHRPNIYGCRLSPL